MFRLILLITLLLPTLAFSSDNSFHSGISAFKKDNFKQAITDFESALKEKPNQPQILFNLGLSHQKMGQKGKALAFWRKTLSIDPYFSKASDALDHANRIKSTSSSLWEGFRSHFLSFLPFNLILALLLLIFTLFGFSIINHFALVQKNRENEFAKKIGFPLKPCLYSLFFLTLLSLTLFKTYDQLQPRGTVIKSELPLLVGPNKDSLELIKVNEGLEVILKKTFNNWIQVQVPGGPSGWTQDQNIIQTRGRQL